MSLTKICEGLGIPARYGSPEQILGVPSTGGGAAVMLDGKPISSVKKTAPVRKPVISLPMNLGTFSWDICPSGENTEIVLWTWNWKQIFLPPSCLPVSYEAGRAEDSREDAL